MKKIVFLLFAIIALNSNAQKALIITPSLEVTEVEGNGEISAYRWECHAESAGFEGCCANYAIICNGNFQQMVSVCGSIICQLISGMHELLIPEEEFPKTVDLDLSHSIIEGADFEKLSADDRIIVLNKLNNAVLNLDKDYKYVIDGVEVIMKAGRYQLTPKKLEVTVNAIY